MKQYSILFLILQVFCLFNVMAEESNPSMQALGFRTMDHSVNVITGEYCELQTDLKGLATVRRCFTGIDQPSWSFNLPLNNFKQTVRSGIRELHLEPQPGQEFIYTILPQETSRNDDPLLIEKVWLSDQLVHHYHYLSHPTKRAHLISRRDDLNGGFLINEYYDGSDAKDPLRDWRIGKVKVQKAPVGTDATPITTHTFFYHTGYTEVYDAYQNLTIYRYGSEGYLSAIEYYLKSKNGGNALYRTERLFWQKDENELHLTSKVLEDEKGTIVRCQTYTYNQKGQVVKETLYGNLTGTNTVSIVLQEDGIPIPNGVESYSHYREYADDSSLQCLKEDNHRSTLYQYDSNTGLLSAELISDGEKILLRRFYQYDEEGNLHSTIEDDGCTPDRECLIGVTERHLTEQANDTSSIDASPAQEPICTYDLANRLIRKEEMIQDKLVSTSYRYDYLGNQIAIIDSLGNETQCEYDALSRLIKMTSPSVLDDRDKVIRPSTTYEYDICDHLIKTIDPKGYETTITYNARGKPVDIHYPDGTQEHYEYNLDGSLKKAIAKTGQAILYTRDIFDRVINAELYDYASQLQGKTESIYNAFHLLSATDVDGLQTIYTYDETGRLTRVKKDSFERSSQMDTFYDSQGNIVQHEWYGEEPADYTQKSYAYNENGEPNKLQIKDAFGKILKETLEESLDHPTIRDEEHINQLGQRVLKQIQVDAQGNVVISLFDALGRCESREKKNSLGIISWKQEMRYDAAGNKTRQTNTLMAEHPQMRVDIWNYGPNNRVESIIEASGSATEKRSEFSYNSFGQLETFVKPDGTTLSHLYNSFGQLSDYFASDDSFHYRYKYDAKDNIIQVDDLLQNTTTTRTFNGFGELIAEKLGNNLQLSSQYDRQGRRTALTLPDQSSIEYHYDAAYLKAISRYSTDKQLCYRHDYLDYNLNGQLTSSQLIGQAGRLSHCNQEHCFTIDSSHWSEAVHHASVEQNRSIQKIITKDPKGSFTCTFCYDDQHQLIQENGPVNHTFAYDSASNRISDNELSYSVNDLDQLISNGPNQYSYDYRGNRQTKSIGSQTYTYCYDALDRLIEFKIDGEFSIHYIYDAFHRCLSKTTFNWDSDTSSWKKEETLNFLYDGHHEIGTTDDHGKLLELRVLGLGHGAEIGAAIAHELQGKIYAPIHNHQGSVACLIDIQEGTPAEFYRYSAFGEEQIFSGDGEQQTETQIQNFWRFSSKRHDPDTKLIHFGKRLYDPSVGRWTTKDPIGAFDGPNGYSFLHNDPLSHHDLYGLFSFSDLWRKTLSKSEFYFHSLKQFANHLSNIIRNDLSYFNFVKKDLEKMGTEIFGKGFLQFAGYYGNNRPNSGSFGPEEINDKVRVTVINGILNIKENFLDNLTSFSKTHGNTKIHYVFYPTEGWTRDLFNCLFAKLGIVSLQSKMMAETWKKLIQEMGGVDGKGMIIHYAHSIGATNTYIAKNLLSPEERQMIHVTTLGSPTMIPSNGSGFASVVNYVSKRDGVCQIGDPLGLLLGCFQKDSNIIFLGSIVGVPLIDHLLTDQTYSQILEALGEKFYQSHRLFDEMTVPLSEMSSGTW